MSVTKTLSTFHITRWGSRQLSVLLPSVRPVGVGVGWGGGCVQVPSPPLVCRKLCSHSLGSSPDRTLGGAAATPVLPSSIMTVRELRGVFSNSYYSTGGGNLPSSAITSMFILFS